jgi:uncharacterized tellurite resistance protein B-like protein
MLGNRQMMDRLRAWLTEGQGELSGDRDTLQLAVAALLMEAAQVDGPLGEQERAAVQRLLERKFRLSAEASRALAATGERKAERSAQLFGFTRTINERLPPGRRVELIEMLWEVAYADGALDPLEDAMLRQVGGLIDVGDPERDAARQRVLQRLGIAEDSCSSGLTRLPWRRVPNHDLRRYRSLHQVQVHGLRRSLPGGLLLRGREHARHPP